MAGIAGLTRDNMVRPFAGGVDSVVTARAASGNFIVINLNHWLKYRGRVARLAAARRQYVSRTLKMATGATTDHFVMVDANHRFKHNDGMARGAIVRRVDVRDVLADRIRVVMARKATSQYIGVIDTQCGAPYGRRMACVATIRRCDMVGRFPGGGCAVVTAGAGARPDLRVIDAEHRNPRLSLMTLIALIG